MVSAKYKGNNYLIYQSYFADKLELNYRNLAFNY